MVRVRFGMVLATSAMVFLAPAGVLGQDAPPSQQRPRGEARQDGEVHPQRLRALLERRLEQLQSQEERIQAMLERLDAGASAMELMAELRAQGDWPLMADGLREGPREAPRNEPGRGGPPPMEPMTPEEYRLWHGRIVAFFDEHAPELAKRMRDSGQTDETRRAVHRLRREVERLLELKEQNSDEFAPSLVRLLTGLHISEVVAQVRQHVASGTLTEDRLKAFHQELTVAVGKQYDAQLEARAKLLERMGTRLAGALERLEREKAERSRRVEAEVRVMLDRATQSREPQDRGRPQERRPN